MKNPSSAAFAAWSFGVSEPRKTRISWGTPHNLPSERNLDSGDAGRQAHRETYVTTNYGNYAAEHGLYDAEVAQIEKSMQDFRFVPDLVKTFAKPDWYTKQANRLAVVQSLKFNIGNIMADLTRAGFAERVVDEVKRKEFIELRQARSPRRNRRSAPRGTGAAALGYA